MEYSSIKLSKKVIEYLKDCKIHPRETYEDIIVRALEGELYPADPYDVESDGATSHNPKTKEGKKNAS